MKVTTKHLLDLAEAIKENKMISFQTSSSSKPIVAEASAFSFERDLHMYTVVDPYKELKEAHESGETIEYRPVGYSSWYACESPSWASPPESYRIKTKCDPYAELKKAYDDGAYIEVRGSQGKWILWSKPDWTLPVDYYRIRDPYRELKEAHANGAGIECLQAGTIDVWVTINHPKWDGDVSAYRVKKEDPYRELKKAYNNGARIEFFTDPCWITAEPTWTFPVDRYRIADPYRKLKEAFDRGAKIYCLAKDVVGPLTAYYELKDPAWDGPVSEYFYRFV